MSGIPIEEQTYERNREVRDKLGVAVVLKNTVLKYSSKTKNIDLALVHRQWRLVAWEIRYGMITSFVGQFDDFRDAITSATYTHSYIGEKLSESMYVVPPSRLISEIPYVMKELEN